MHRLTFYPEGNADAFVIRLSGGKQLIFDYADRRDPKDKDDKRCDLPAELRKELAADKRKHYDVAVFTHLDQDHYDGMTKFFYLEHDTDYQGEVDGKERVKMDVMWVPAAVLTEKLEEEESKVIQKEAWYRLKNKKGILVFSRPDSLKEAIEKKGIKFDDVKHLIIDAGRLVPSFTQKEDGVEFWVHSPHASRQNDDEVVIRNDHAIVLLAAFVVGGVETKVQLFADVKHHIIGDIVSVTRYRKRDHRLEWDVFKIAHHCSYTAIGPEKGDTMTKPTDEVDWLFNVQGHEQGIIVSTSKPIPSNDDDDQPPHRQASKYYKSVVGDKDGEFVVTMEHPKPSAPKPLVILIDKDKARIQKEQVPAVAAIASVSAPRAG
jgi:beta-lactamase superfamily II metal-dependent hydrolase